MPESVLVRARLRAIVFDLDGTLYRQDSLRRAMLLRLLRAYATRPLGGFQTFRILAAYRQAQEQLRESPTGSTAPRTDLAEAQVQLASERTKAGPDAVMACVARWMEQEPLALLARYLQPGLLEFLHASKARDLRLGVLSDYPADAKLKALGLDGQFDVVLAAQSAEVGVFKPHPRGLLRVAERLETLPQHCLYVGDRAEIDGPAAVAAGMACCIVRRRLTSPGPPLWMQVDGYPQLHELVLGSDDNQSPIAAPQPSLHRR